MSHTQSQANPLWLQSTRLVHPSECCYEGRPGQLAPAGGQGELRRDKEFWTDSSARDCEGRLTSHRSFLTSGRSKQSLVALPSVALAGPADWRESLFQPLRQTQGTFQNRKNSQVFFTICGALAGNHAAQRQHFHPDRFQSAPPRGSPLRIEGSQTIRLKDCVYLCPITQLVKRPGSDCSSLSMDDGEQRTYWRSGSRTQKS